MSNDLISRSMVMDYLKEQKTNVIAEKNKKGLFRKMYVTV